MIATNSHEPVPLPAFDIHDNLIVPARYELMLKGAIVRVKATIVHQFLPGARTDNFYADVQELTVLRPPFVESHMTASKRKVADAVRQHRDALKAKAVVKSSVVTGKRTKRGS